MKKEYKTPLLKVHVVMKEHLMVGQTEEGTGTGESGGGAHGYGDPAKGSGFFDDDDWGNVWANNDEF